MTDRRIEPRSTGPAVGGITARVRAGHDVRIVDLSASGALIEGARPLRPGARVEMHLVLNGQRAALTAHVVRCLVATIDAHDGITYHAALSFECRFDWTATSSDRWTEHAK